MAVSEEHGFDFVFFVFEPLGVRNDKIYTWHIFLCKPHPGIYEDNIVIVLDGGHIAADFAQATKVNNLKAAHFFLSLGRVLLGPRLGLPCLGRGASPIGFLCAEPAAIRVAMASLCSISDIN